MFFRQYILLGLLLTETVLFAEESKRILPEFSGFWYTAADMRDTSLCNMTSTYTYTNRGSLENIKNILQASLSSDGRCIWQAPDADDMRTVIPPDFPGNTVDLAALAFQTQRVTFYCKDSKEKIYISKNFIIYPSYHCPNGSIYFCSAEQECGCYQAAQTICALDIPGRDLENTPIVAKAGHVGLALSPANCSTAQLSCEAGMHDGPLTSSIAEVLNKIDAERHSVIYLHSLTNFVEASKFWGAHYDLPNHKMSMVDLINISFNFFQQFYLPSAYTYSWDYKPASVNVTCTTDQDSHKIVCADTIIPGKFRCDTFVYYLYQKAGFQIPYSGIMMPYSIYNAFIGERSMLPFFRTEHVVNLSKFVVQRNLETNISAVFQHQPFDLQQADYLTRQYDMATNMRRQDKLAFLWQLSQSYQHDTVRLNYLLDVLSYLQPYELAKQLISLYQKTQKTDTKTTLLGVLSNSINFPSRHAMDLLTSQDREDISSIIEFLHHVSLTEQNTTLASTAALAITPALSGPERSEVFVHLRQLQSGSVGHLAYAQQLLVSVLSSGAEQAQILNAVLGQNDHVDFALAVCELVPLYPYLHIQPHNHIILEKFMMKHEQALLQYAATREGSCYWLSTYAALQAATMVEKIHFMRNFILNEHDFNRAMSLVESISLEDLSKMPKPDLQAIKQHVRVLQHSVSSVGYMHHMDDHALNMKLRYLNAYLERE